MTTPALYEMPVINGKPLIVASERRGGIWRYDCTACGMSAMELDHIEKHLTFKRGHLFAAQRIAAVLSLARDACIAEGRGLRSSLMSGKPRR